LIFISQNNILKHATFSEGFRMTKKVEIISIGNELLIGKTLNTNAQWMSRRITSIGLSVTRINVVGDTVLEISAVLQESLSRNPDFIITTGGLGPTFDDKTLEGLAHALDSTLKVDEKALAMVKKKYLSYAEEQGRREYELTAARVKMATIPIGTEPILNPVGTAPGVLTKQKNVIIYSLPGVPSEMKAIFENSILKVFKDSAGDMMFFETSLFVSRIVESEIAPLIDQVMHNHPHIYIKSHPMGTERKPTIELHLTTTAENKEIAKKQMGIALSELTSTIQEKGALINTGKRGK
jgi:molybdenum cofactor synthesis domain-containing protein